MNASDRTAFRQFIASYGCCVGPTGPIGTTGPTGSPGIGFTGSAGSTGPTGIQGIAGPTGPQGIEGNTGPVGIQGIAGPTGSQGIQGIAGPTGPQGIQGLTGPTGTQGIAGPTGLQGIQGIAGPTGPQGIEGPTGLQGIQGIAGPTGPQGIQGIAGPTGPQGIQGIEGPTGPQGIQGIEGPTGPQGIAGPTGSQGIQGIQGITGPQGIEGPTGPTGLQGPIGTGGALGYYGSFYDTTTQTNNAVENAITYNTTSEANSVSINSGSRITVANTGTYNIQFSAVFTQTNSSSNQVDLWVKRNGTVVPDTNTRFTLAGQVNSVESWNFVITLNANDFIELFWYSSEESVNISYLDVQSTPTRPAMPSIILTVTQVMYLQEGPTGLPGPTGPQGIEGPTGPQGIEGFTGPQGIEGFTGPQGPTGPQGIEGFTGPQGIEGPTGLQGPTGPQGIEGPTGPVSTFRPTNDYYVALNGNNTTGDGSYSNPWQTIQHAITTLEAIPLTASTQAIIHISPGTYVENLTFTTGYVSVMSTYNGRDYTQTARINGNITVVITDSNDLYSKQVILQGIQVIGTVTDNSTIEHSLILQDCYVFSAGRSLYQNTTAGVACRTRIQNCIFNGVVVEDPTNPPLVEISSGDAYIDRCELSYNGINSVLLINGTGTVYATNCDFTSTTTTIVSPGVIVVKITNQNASTFGICLFRFTNTGSKTNADGFWLLRYDPLTLPGQGISLGYCTFAAYGMSTSENVAGSNGTGPLGNSAIIAYGACTAVPNQAYTIAGAIGTNKVQFSVVT
jgi:hypothetical protein